MKYPYSVSYTGVDGHYFWVAKSLVLKGCIGQGDTSEEAENELAKNEVEWLDTAEECGIPIPKIPLDLPNEYSGKLTVRLAPAVHEKAAIMAKKQNISLNQYICDAIVNWNAETSFSHGKDFA